MTLRRIHLFISTTTLLLLASASTLAAEAIIGKVRVSSGDSVAFPDSERPIGQVVQLEGVAAPDKSQVCWNAEGEFYACGRVAIEALKFKIAERPVRCEGRRRNELLLIGTCFTSDGTDLGGWLVEKGYAVARRHHSTRYVPQEEAAKKAKQGLWAGRFEKPWNAQLTSAFSEVRGVVFQNCEACDTKGLNAILQKVHKWMAENCFQDAE